MQRLQKKQPLVAPDDVLRYFVSPEEAGQICLLACILGRSGEIFFPKLGKEQMRTFSEICDRFLEAQGLEKQAFGSESRRNTAIRMIHSTSPWTTTGSGPISCKI